MANIITPSDYLDVSSGDQEVNLQEQADRNSARSFRNTAQALSERQADRTSVGYATDEDVDLPTAKLELQLQDLQQQLFHEVDSTRKAVLSKQCEQLAAQLVGAAAPEERTAPAKAKQEKESISEHLRNQYDADRILGNAAERLETEVAQGFNQNLASEDEGTIRATMETLHHLNESPEMFDSASNATEITQDGYDAAVEAFGAEIANDVMTLSQAVTSGQVSSAEALATASRNPKLLAAVLSGAQAGFWKIAL